MTLSIIFLVMLFLKPHFSTMVDNLVHDEVKFTSENSDVWAEFPGKNNIIIVNNITFLHHRNLNEGESPSALTPDSGKQEVQEVFSVADIENRHHKGEVYTDHDTVIYPTKYTYTPYTSDVAEALDLSHPLGKEPQPRKEPSTDKNMNSVNFPLFFFWHRIQNMAEEMRYNMLFGGLVGNLLKDGTLQSSVEANVLAVLIGLDSYGKAKTSILDDLDVSNEMKMKLYNDQINGIGSSMGLVKWCQLVRTTGSTYFSDLKNISEYFGVPLSEISQIGRFISRNISTATNAINNLLECPDNDCNSLFIFKKQTSTSNLSTILLKSNTLMDGKNLLFKIEYAAFYEDNYSKIDEYKNLYWTDEQADLYYDIDFEKLKPNKTWNVLTHYSNLGYLRVACKTFWADNLSKDEQKLGYLEQSQKVRDLPFLNKKFSSLEHAITRFQFKNPQQAEVVCGYVEHVYSNMVLENNKGSFELFLLNQLASENMLIVLENLRKLAESITHQSFVSFTLENNPSITCSNVLNVGSFISEDKVKELCAKYATSDKENVTQFLFDLYDNCEHGSPTTSFDFNALTLQSFCTGNPELELSYQSLFSALYTELAKIYQFGSENFSVTKLAILQLAKAGMTSNNNPYIDADKYPTGLTAHIWDPETFSRPFEMAFFVDKFGLSKVLLDDLDLGILTQMFNKSSMFNPLVLYYTVVFARQNNFEYFKKFMGLEEKHFPAFWQFIVLFLREYHMEGFFIKLSEADLVNGLKTPFIRDIYERPILLGGDPSTPYPTFIRLQKADYVFEKFTGNKDLSKLDNFYAMNNSPIITNDMPIYNGNSTSVYTTNPWGADIPMSGCDNFCPEKQVTSDESYRVGSDEKRSLAVYGPPLNRTIEYNYVNTTKVDFMNCKKDHYRLNQAQYKAEFAQYHQDKVDGYFNMTSVFNFPILLSQNHLYGVDDRIASKYAYFDKDNKPITANEELDGGFYETEQRTRGVTQMNLNLHFNLEIKDSLLFVGAEDKLEQLRPSADLPFLVPLYNLEFWTKLPEKGWKSIFGKVGSANSFLDSYLTIFLPLFFGFLVIFVILLLLYLREVKKGKTDDEYEKISTENEDINSNNEGKINSQNNENENET